MMNSQPLCNREAVLLSDQLLTPVEHWLKDTKWAPPSNPQSLIMSTCSVGMSSNLHFNQVFQTAEKQFPGGNVEKMYAGLLMELFHAVFTEVKQILTTKSLAYIIFDIPLQCKARLSNIVNINIHICFRLAYRDRLTFFANNIHLSGLRTSLVPS